MLMSTRLIRSGAYSEMNSAVPSASGNAKVIATRATRTVPVRTAAIPKRPAPASGSQDSVVRKRPARDLQRLKRAVGQEHSDEHHDREDRGAARPDDPAEETVAHQPLGAQRPGIDIGERGVDLTRMVDDGGHDACSGCRGSATARCSTCHANCGGTVASDAGAVGAASRNWSRL